MKPSRDARTRFICGGNRFGCAAGSAAYPGSIAGHAIRTIRPHHQSDQSGCAGIRVRSSYVAAKAVLESLTRTMAVELAAAGITGTPSRLVPLKRNYSAQITQKAAKVSRRYLSRVPNGQVCAIDRDCVSHSLSASDQAAFITGQTIFVDGGASLGSL